MSSLATRIMIRGLREKTDEKEETLSGIIGEVEALQLAKGSGGLGDLTSEWDAGKLYSNEVKRENIVDVKGDVSSAHNNFSRPNSVSAAVSRTNSRVTAQSREQSSALASGALRSGALATSGGLQPKRSGPVETITEEIFRPPEWAKNEKVKLVVKENARLHTQDVDLGKTVGSLSTSGTTEKRENIAGAPAGNVKNILEKWGKNDEEEARKLKLKQEQEMAELRAQQQAQKEAEEQLAKEAEAKAAADEARKEAEEKERQEAESAAAKAKAEEEAAVMAEALKKRKVALPGISPIEPSNDDELVDYLKRKDEILDKCIYSAGERLKILKAM